MSPIEPEAAQAAWRVARDSAAAAGVGCTEIHDADTAHEVATLLDEVWGRDAEAGHVLAPEALAAIAHAGGQVTGAWRDGELVGATAAFLGHDATRGEVFLHSHVTGVRAPAAARGVGAALKWHQRAWCLDRGLAEARWTFDPLIRRNVAFNLVRLGAVIAGWVPDAYGQMPDARNRGLPTDRVLARWPLRSRRVEAAAEGRRAAPDVGALRRTGAEVVLEPGPAGAPHTSPSDAERQLLRIPDDIEALRAQDPRSAAAWVEAIRQTLGLALQRGARVTGATRDGWLVLDRARGVTELAR